MRTLNFEISYLLKQRSTWIYFFVLMALAFLVVNIAGGMLDSVKIQISGDQVKLNSPGIVSTFMSVFNLLGIVISANLFGNAVYRDYRYQSDQMVFSSGINKTTYLLPRFLAPFIVNGLIYLAVPLGIAIASLMPYLDQEMFGEFIFAAYWKPLLYIVYPNTLFVGALFFLLTIIAKNNSVNWIGIIVFYVLYGVAQNLSGDIDNKELTALLEPFGLRASATVSTGWSAEEQNTRSIELENLLLWNRVLWSSIGVILFSVGYFLFSFTRFSFGKKKKAVKTTNNNKVLFKKLNLPQPTVSFSSKLVSYQLQNIIQRETLKILKSTYFKIIVVLMLVLLITAASQIGKMYDTVTFPVTYKVAEVLLGSVRLLLYIFAILFTGEMVWNSRKFKIAGIEDAFPIATWQRLTGQWIALNLLIITLLLVVWIIGIGTPYFMGFPHHEFHVFGGYLLNFYSRIFLFTGASFFIQSVVSNRFTGYFILGIWYLIDSFFFQALLQHNLLIPLGSPQVIYSDMNGFGGTLLPMILFRFYWASIITLLIYVALRFYPRGTDIQWKNRWHSFKGIPVKQHVKHMSPGLLGMLIFGGTIFYNTNVLNQFEFSNSVEKDRLHYEQQFGKYKYLNQPKLTKVDLEVDLYPKKQQLAATCNYTLQNNSNRLIDTLILHFDEKDTRLTTHSKDLELITEDKATGFHLYHLNTPVFPQQQLELSFEIEDQKRGFTNQFSPGNVVQNGTFVWNSILPDIGYNDRIEISRNRTRRQYDLEEKPQDLHRNHHHGIQQNGVSVNADQIEFSATLSTSKDQIAFTSGNLKKQWEKDNRKYFRYELNGKMSSIYSFVSAQYESYTTQWHSPLGDSAHHPVDITVNYHPTHRYNVELMADAIKASLDYYTAQFGPYQHDLVRIMEFPRYASMAVSFPNTIPFSESIGFIANVNQEEGEEHKVNYPFWVTAHEVAHQWWAHQLIPANVEGASFLTESLAQYSSVRVLEKKFGQKMVARFLKNELNTYLTSRNDGNEKERPLSIVASGQQHVFYNKGAIVLYALSEYIGEQRFNQFLAGYLDSVRFKGPPYPTTISFLEELYEVTPDSLNHLIHDWIEKITLYNFSLKEATYSRDEDLNYHVELNLEAYKYQNQGDGKELEIDMNDPVEIVFYGRKNKEIFREFVPLKKGQQTVKLTLNKKPGEVEIDPRNLLIKKDWIQLKKTKVSKKK